MRINNYRVLFVPLLLVSLVGFGSLSLAQRKTSTPEVEQDASSRQIVLEEFTKARPISGSSKTVIASRTRNKAASSSLTKIAKYRRVTRPLVASLGFSTAELGVTIWRLRPGRDAEGARLLVMEGGKSAEWTPERVEVDQLLNVGDRVRMSIESPRSGFLYVIDREQYADGSLGDPYLIFPTERTRGGDNRVRPGKLIDIPAQEDDPSYFTLVPSPARSDQVGELLTIVVTAQPLTLPITDKPLKLQVAELSQWEKLWSATFERFELEGGAGTAWTIVEKEAAAARTKRYLTRDEPAPQTVYRLAGNNKTAMLVTLPLRYKNSQGR